MKKDIIDTESNEARQQRLRAEFYKHEKLPKRRAYNAWLHALGEKVRALGAEIKAREEEHNA